MAYRKTDKPRMMKFDAIKKARLLKLIRQGYGVTVASRRVGVTYATVNLHMHKDKEFMKAVREAEVDRDAEMVHDAQRGLRDAAKAGNVTACQVILYNRDPERWRDARRVEHSGPGGEPIRHSHELTGEYEQLSDDELQAVLKRKLAEHNLVT